MDADKLILENFIQKHPVEVVRNLEQLDDMEVASFLNDLSIDLSKILFLHMDRFIGSKYLEAMDSIKAALILEKLPHDHSQIFLRILSEQSRIDIVNKFSNQAAQLFKQILSYPDESVAAHLDTSINIIYDDLKVENVLSNLQKYRQENSAYLFIVSRSQIYKGILPIQEIFTINPEKKIDSIQYPQVEPIPARANLHDISDIKSWQDYLMLPVVDKSGLLIGALKYETLRQSEKKISKSSLSSEAVSTGKALGELFQIGLLALLRSAPKSVKKS